MSDPFIGEIRMFGGNFAPLGWAFCAGQLMAISQNDALFALIGTTYGGDGQVTFGLPDLRGRGPIHQGQGPGLSSYVLGQLSGTESVTVTTSQIPAHTHPAALNNAAGTTNNPQNATWASAPNTQSYNNTAPDVAMSASSITTAGSSVPHDNMPPFLAVSFIICLEGIFPSRN